MPNSGLVSITGFNASPELTEKWKNWFDASYAPIHLELPPILGIERYTVLKNNPVYPESLNVFHTENLAGLIDNTTNPNRLAVIKDSNTSFKKIGWVWYKRGFELLKSFRTDIQNEEDTRVDNAPILHIEALRLSPGQQEQFNDWFVRWAYRVYIPILMKLPGLKAYNCFHHSGRDFQESRDYHSAETDYPADLSLIYFEDVNSFENYERSPELIAFREAIRVNFPGSLDYKWYVQYQLQKSWRK
jgi:hypothetical protein